MDTHQKHNHTNNAQDEPKITQPQPILKRRRVTSQLPSPHPHPQIRHSTTNLFANNCSHNHRNHLQAILLRVEPKQLGEQLRNLDRHHDARPQERHGVGDGGDHDVRVRRVRQGLDKVVEGDGGRVDAAEGHVLLLEGALFHRGGGAADVA